MQTVFQNEHIKIEVSKYGVGNIWEKYGKLRFYPARTGDKRVNHIDLTNYANGDFSQRCPTFPGSRMTVGGDDGEWVFTDRYFDDEFVRISVVE